MVGRSAGRCGGIIGGLTQIVSRSNLPLDYDPIFPALEKVAGFFWSPERSQAMSMPKNYGVGRPPLYGTAEEMQAVIDRYYASCDAREAPYTMSGLAAALGMSRQSLIRYGERDQFCDTVKQARREVESSIEERLLSGRAAVGAIFNLKNNFGWVDKSEQDITSGGKPVKNEWHVHPVTTSANGED